MPLVQVVGVSKCGTTDLFKRLARHPDFVESANKGPHFWDESPVPESPAGGGGGGGGFSEYLALFDALAARVAAAPQSLSADASSNTFTASGVWRRGHSPVGNVSIGELLFEAAPYSRLILLLRDPSERLFSAFHYYRRLYGGGGPLATAAQFDAHVDESLATWAACLTRHRGDAQPCIRAFEPQQLIKGMYSQFLWDWTPRFPAHQLLVMRLEDYSADMERHLRAVFQFAGMRAPSDDEWQTILGAARANARGGARQALRERADMLPQTRQKLRAFYAPFNAQLAQMLRDERFAWADA
jgi:N-acetylgalactosamine 4-sulfate 6-O-sulfotransferase